MQLIRSLMLITLLLTVPAVAQERKDIFANPQNLEVLPKDISSKELGATMKGFAMGLGLRCENCHVGEPNTPLETFDFQSDEKTMKQKARAMLKMVLAINTQYVPALNDIDPATRVEVRCVTCHRGRPQPKLIQDVLDEQLAEGGADTAVAKYGELRQQFYGTHSYDFSEMSLPMYAQALFGKGEAEAALEFATINTQNHPDSYYSFFVHAELNAAAGDKEAAIKSYRRAAELNPRAKGFLDGRIAALGADSPE